MTNINVKLGTPFDRILITFEEQLTLDTSRQIYQTLRTSVGFAPSVIDWRLWKAFR